MKYRNRSTWKSIFGSPITLVLALVALGFFAKAAWNVHQKAELSAARLAQAQHEFAKLQERQRDLSFKVERLSTEEGIEAEIRTKYRAVKADESVAVIVDDKSTTADLASAGNASTTGSNSDWSNFWKKLLHLFSS